MNDELHPGQRHTSVRLWFARVGGVLGAIAAVIAIWQSFPSQQDDERLIFSEDSRIIELKPAPNKRWTDDLHGVHELKIDGGTLIVPDDVTVMANHIRLQNGARIIGNRFAVVATTIEGGVIDVSGKSGPLDGSPGANGGTLIAAAARIINTSLIANGGDGGPGVSGHDGLDGRNGRCDGFGKWVKANPGRNGATGGSGGSGGSGGAITVYHSPAYPMQAKLGTEGGLGGPPGIGGRGGTGGRGCTGLGGAQSNAQNGKPGISGQRGVSGESTLPDIIEIPFEVLVNAIGDHSRAPLAMTEFEVLLMQIRK